jgi:hypothetical protein
MALIRGGSAVRVLISISPYRILCVLKLLRPFVHAKVQNYISNRIKHLQRFSNNYGSFSEHRLLPSNQELGGQVRPMRLHSASSDHRGREQWIAPKK